MLATFLSLSKRLTRAQSFRVIRCYCQKSNEDVLGSQKESRLVAVLNGINSWEPCKTVLTEKKFQLIQRWKLENGGSIKNFDDIAKIKGINVKTIESLRRFCESQLHNDKHTFDTQTVSIQQAPIEQAPIEEAPTEQTPVHEFGHIDDEFYANSFNQNQGQFILYDETIPPIDLDSTRPIQSHSNNGCNESSAKNFKSLKLALEPKLNNNSSIQSFTSIYQDTEVIAITRFSASGKWEIETKIDAWNYYKLGAATGVKNLNQTCDQLSKIVEQIPASDIYLMDDHIKAQRFHKPIPPKKMAEIVQISQQCAVLLAFLQKRNQNRNDSDEAKQPNVHFMGYATVGHLYKLFVGYEAISTQSIIKQILHNDVHIESPELHEIDVSNEMKNVYFKSNSVARECMGKSMLMGLTFIRLRLLNSK